MVAPELLENALAQARKSGEAGIWYHKTMAPEEIEVSDILQQWEERGDTSSQLHLVGQIRQNGKVICLRLTADVSGLPTSYFDITLEREGKRITIITPPRGKNASKVLMALSNNEVMVAPELLENALAQARKSGEAGIWYRKAMALEAITVAEILQQWEESGDASSQLHLVGQLQQNGKVTGLRLTAEVSGLSSQYFDITLERDGKRLTVTTPPRSKNASKVLVALNKSGGVMVAPELLENALAQARKSGEAGIWYQKTMALEAITVAEILQQWEERGDASSQLHLVGLLRSDGKVTGLRLTADVSGFSQGYFDITLEREGKRLTVTIPPRGTNVSKVLVALSKSGGVMVAPELLENALAQARKSGEAGVWYHKIMALEEITVADILQQWEERGDASSQLHLVGLLQQNGKVTGLRLTADVSGLTRSCFDITLEREGNRLTVTTRPRGVNASKVLAALSKNEGIVIEFGNRKT